MVMFFSFSFSSSGLVRRAHTPRGACSSFLFTSFLLSSQALLILTGCHWSRGQCEVKAQPLQPQPAQLPGSSDVHMGRAVFTWVSLCPVLSMHVILHLIWKTASLPSSFSNMFLHTNNTKKDQQEYHWFRA